MRDMRGVMLERVSVLTEDHQELRDVRQHVLLDTAHVHIGVRVVGLRVAPQHVERIQRGMELGVQLSHRCLAHRGLLVGVTQHGDAIGHLQDLHVKHSSSSSSSSPRHSPGCRRSYLLQRRVGQLHPGMHARERWRWSLARRSRRQRSHAIIGPYGAAGLRCARGRPRSWRRRRSTAFRTARGPLMVWASSLRCVRGDG